MSQLSSPFIGMDNPSTFWKAVSAGPQKLVRPRFVMRAFDSGDGLHKTWESDEPDFGATSPDAPIPVGMLINITTAVGPGHFE